ncbi:MafI family immunity protein [Chryseobacterium potabilaquae]|uniref:MafI family immunity protein n=1 Tax=Chryseobacterium potabilaquae TaxID=2675057 RepID=A0A6N4WZF9_9FLAO|nr:MafI family immunity protein [Chryseobacterium potabilaquae]CAA7193826.1 hypothetical protein CHRY9293_00237 [Chryseobacterium potabilaquae]
MKTLTNTLLRLIEIASIIGLNDNDVKNAKDYLMHNEFGLCYDTIITQIYEYDIEIDIKFYQFITKIGNLLNLTHENYFFMKELISDENNIPKSIKSELAKIIASLE